MMTNPAPPLATRTTLERYADAFSYPRPGSRTAWRAALAEVPAAAGQAQFAAFLAALEGLSQGEWEELYTRTLDLNPAFAPYLGFQMWGDSYARGEFMAQLSHAMQENQIERGGELPDHLGPVLRYLAAVADPLPQLLEVLQPALTKMTARLEREDASNPYRHLLQAVAAACQDWTKA
jgi:nitrate reductase delta subunit